MTDEPRAAAVDRGEKALEESVALVECLREACDGRALNSARLVTVLAMVSERMGSVQTAFAQLRAA